MKRIVFLAITALVLTARAGSAQGFVSPFIGTTIASPTDTGTHTDAGYGVALGKLGKVIGAETEIAFYPEVIDSAANAVAKNKVISFSGDLLLGPTLGGVKPYFAVGAGNLRLNITGLSSVLRPDPTSISNDYFTVNFGGGVFGFFSKHVGVRGDLRYFRAYGLKFEDLEATGLDLTHFNFWRASVGLVAKF